MFICILFAEFIFCIQGVIPFTVHQNSSLSTFKQSCRVQSSELIEQYLSFWQWMTNAFFKVAFGVCFALNSWKEYLLLFTYPITLGKDVTFPNLNLYLRSEFFIRKLDNSLCTSLIIRLTCILIINIHKNVIRYFNRTRI